METKDEVIELDLKYCERCGGLWLRVRGLQDIYCSSCVVAMSEVAVGYRARRGPRLPIHHNLDAYYLHSAAISDKGGQA